MGRFSQAKPSAVLEFTGMADCFSRTLTAGVDNINGTSGNDIFNATALQLNAFDVISGNTGTDTLQIDDTATGAVADFTGVTVTGIERLVITSKLGLLGNGIDTTTVLPDLTSVQLGLAAAATQTVTTTKSAAVSITNSTAQNIIVVGGGTTASVTTGNANIKIGDTAAAASDANAFTSVTAKVGTGTGTVNITDNSGTSGVIGSTLTSATVQGATTGNIVLTGKGLTSVSFKDTAGSSVTITNATASHALSLTTAGVNGATITDNVATSAAITTAATNSGSTGNAFTLAGTLLSSLNIAGTKSLTLTSTIAKLSGVVITGAGGVSSDFSGDGASTSLGYVSSVDTTGSTAVAGTGTIANAITIGNSTSFAGGAGTDNVTTGANTKAITLGAGDDSLTLTALLGTGGTANGGDGTDTLVLTNTLASGLSSSAFNAQLSSFEKLEISAVSYSNATASVAPTVDLGYLVGVNSYVVLDGITATNTGAAGDDLTYVQSINNLANGGTVEFAGDMVGDVAGDTAEVSIAVGVSNASYGLTDSVVLKLTSSNAVRAAGAVSATGVETVNIVTNNTSTSPTAQTNTLSLTDAAMTSLVVSGTAGLDLTGATLGTSVKTVDASGITGTGNAFSVTLGNNTTSAVTVKGTAVGVNTIDASALSTKSVTISVGGADNTSSNVLKGGAVADVISGGAGGDTITSNGGLDVLTGNGGADTFVLADGTGTTSSQLIITDYAPGVTGSDLLSLTGIAGASAVTATGWTVSSGIYTKAGATVADFYAALSVSGTTALATAAFENSGNTYVFYAGATTATSDDSFIQLTGVTGLTSVSTTAGAHVLYVA